MSDSDRTGTMGSSYSFSFHPAIRSDKKWIREAAESKSDLEGPEVCKIKLSSPSHIDSPEANNLNEASTSTLDLRAIQR